MQQTSNHSILFHRPRALHLIWLALVMFTSASTADARKGFGMSGPMGGEGPASDVVEERTGDIRATGLKPVFPEGLKCEPIASPFASATRYDGSTRRGDRFGGLHGGMDISLKSGTPLLAVARGTVIAKGTGGMLEGNFLWLKLAPQDTGAAYFMFAKYQHLSEVPTLKEGDVVEAGQVIALSGDTGTAGGHYAAGYAHLHLTISAGPSGEFEKSGMFGSMIRGRGASIVDPLLLFVSGLADPEAVYALPEAKKQVPVSVVGPQGAIHPADSKTVWPVACLPQS